MTDPALNREAQLLVRVLKRHSVQLVLAESCTGGMAAATLAQIPGISKNLCGSSVVYQSETKHHWLKIPRKAMRQSGTESLKMSQMLASKVLKLTPHATVSASITGDLGPTGNPGVIFIACEIRKPFFLQVSECVDLNENRSTEKRMRRNKNQRIQLQLLASQHLISMVRQVLSDTLR